MHVRLDSATIHCQRPDAACLLNGAATYRTSHILPSLMMRHGRSCAAHLRLVLRLILRLGAQKLILIFDFLGDVFGTCCVALTKSCSSRLLCPAPMKHILSDIVMLSSMTDQLRMW